MIVHGMDKIVTEKLRHQVGIGFQTACAQVVLLLVDADALQEIRGCGHGTPPPAF